MTARARRTTTLAGPNRVVLGAATAGLVALASAGTALLVLTGTSAVDPVAAPAPPLPSSTPLTRAPGVVVLPSDEARRLTGGSRGSGDAARAPARGPALRVPSVLEVTPVALTFTEVPAGTPVPVGSPPVVLQPEAPATPALRREPVPDEAAPARPGRQVSKGHAKGLAQGHAKKHAKKHAKHPKRHGLRLAWSQPLHFMNR